MTKVITYGTYDLLHYGHKRLLERAKALGDYLIVGVSTDDVVRNYKNKTPIIPFEERKQIVEAIRYVDKVVPQESMDKVAAWDKLHFDVMFHGSDWKNSDMYNRLEEDFSKLGVDLVFLPHTDGVSSTLLSEVLHKIAKEK